jgi:hypothetical protein
MSITIGGNKLARAMLHHVVLLAFTPKRCKRVGKPFDKTTEPWQRHLQLRKLDQRQLVASHTKAKHTGISHITKDIATRDMVTRDMATRDTATKGIATKGRAINIRDLSKVSILMWDLSRPLC